MLFVLAVSRIEKQSREQAFTNNQLMILSVGIYVNFYLYQSVHQSWLWDDGAFDQHN